MALTLTAWKSQFASKPPLVQQKLTIAEEFLRRHFMCGY